MYYVVTGHCNNFQTALLCFIPQKCLEDYREQSARLVDSPLEWVGQFLAQLFPAEDQLFLEPRRFFLRYPPHNESYLSMRENYLHKALGFSQEQLIRLMVEIYQGPPEPYEILHCRSTTSEETLRLFFERIQKHALKYIILDVDKLPFQLQEVKKKKV